MFQVRFQQISKISSVISTGPLSLSSVSCQRNLSTGNNLYVSKSFHTLSTSSFRQYSSANKSVRAHHYQKVNLGFRRTFSGFSNLSSVKAFTQKYGTLFMVFHTSCSVLSIATFFILISSR